MGFPGGSDGKESACNVGDPGLILGSEKIPWKRERLPTPVFLPEEFHGQRSLTGYGLWGCKESDDWAANTHTHLFGCGSFLNSLLNLLQYCFCFVLCFGLKVHGILAPQAGIEPASPASKGEVLTSLDHRGRP